MFYLPTIKDVAYVPDKSASTFADTKTVTYFGQYTFVYKIIDGVKLKFITAVNHSRVNAALAFAASNDRVDRGREQHSRNDEKLASRPPVQRLVMPPLRNYSWS
jgi:hypothetical protein